jgi:malate dehydrogenase (oxaloacetate-decarboxylating)(NADP+)
MIKAMAKNPIVFAMANPDPEISWEDANQREKRYYHGHGPQ